MYTELQKLLFSKKSDLFWDFVKQNSGYDNDLAIILWMTPDTWRYWDAVWKNQKIEFKKWTSIWLDLIRYSEIFLNVSPESSEETILYFLYLTKEEKK